MISVKNLTKYFGPVMAIDGISFEVDKGEVVGFLGPNGAGKTTTMRILTSFLPATSGIAKVAGFDVMMESLDVRRHIGYLPESVPLYSEMRVEEYLVYRAKLKGVGRKERPQRLEYCMDRCRIREVRRRLLHTLSKGYRQRVGLADAMVHDPPILILDEPTTGLDPVQIRETLALIQELGEGHTILLSTHILAEVEAICERVIIINSGRVGVSRTLADLAKQAVTVLEVRGPSEQVAGVLRGTEGVVGVTVKALADGLSRFEVRTQDGADLRETLSQRVTEKGWILRRLDLQRRTLEEAFFDVLRESNPLGDSSAMKPAGSENIQDKSGQAAVKE
ncbi:MAG TPA: ATP-binding cassette domain-containing protein [Gemmataceae bacterium]|nr:ATP-binding cassette domain-containing protein [Gemmataceae bacterium]